MDMRLFSVVFYIMKDVFLVYYDNVCFASDVCKNILFFIFVFILNIILINFILKE